MALNLKTGEDFAVVGTARPNSLTLTTEHTILIRFDFHKMLTSVSARDGESDKLSIFHDKLINSTIAVDVVELSTIQTCGKLFHDDFCTVGDGEVLVPRTQILDENPVGSFLDNGVVDGSVEHIFSRSVVVRDKRGRSHYAIDSIQLLPQPNNPQSSHLNKSCESPFSDYEA